MREIPKEVRGLDLRYTPVGGDHAVWALRNVCNLTPAEVARRMGVSRSSVMSYSSGRASPNRAKQLIICDLITREIEQLKGVEKKYVSKQAPYIAKYNIHVQEFLTGLLEQYSKTIK